MAVDLAQCTIKFTTSNRDSEHPRVFTHVRGTVALPGAPNAATVSAIQIFRHFCRGNFLGVMDDESQELHDFSVKLFDKMGFLKPELVDNEYHRGSGCWGREMDHGTIVYLESIEIQPAYRNQGLGSWILRQLMESSFVTFSSFVICWPCPLEQARDKEDWKVQQVKITDFFRENGFRRIGRTSFFGYTTNPEHPSRNLAVTNDVDAHEYTAVDFEDDYDEVALVRELAMKPGGTEELRVLQEQHDRLLATRFPLHHAIAGALAARVNNANVDVGDVVRRAYAADPASVRASDEHGLTPLHLAAGLHSPEAVRALLALPAESGVLDDLRGRANADGVTPLEACERQMRSMREFMEAMLGIWQGYTDHALRVQHMLKVAAGEQVGGSDDEWVRARKWGCTCGACTAGWLSPRMRFRLLARAALYEDMMLIHHLTFRRNRALEPLDLSAPGIDYLPTNLRLALDARLYRGYVEVIQVIARILVERTGIPLPRVVQSELGRKAYITRGGQVEYALDLVVASALDGHQDGSWDEECRDGREGWDGLVECANDIEFDMVREKLGLARTQTWGPYYDREDEMDEDEDEDEEDEDSDMDD